MPVDFAIRRHAVLDVDLAIAELFLGNERLGGGDEDTVFDLPVTLPSVGVGAVEENFGIGGSFDRDCASAFDFARLRSGGVVNGILGTGDEGGIRVKFLGLLLTMVIREKKSGRKKGENGEFCFHRADLID